jgi:hypothetical protein
MAGSEISKVSGNAQALYKLLGFNDKNRNGIIERTSDPDLNEGYDEAADLNKDEKIVVAEAKYYLQNREDISPKQKQRFALTGADLKILLEIVEIIERSDDKAEAVRKIASRIIEARLDRNETSKMLKEAMGTARTIEDPQCKAETILNIASRMAKAKLFEEALAAVRAIKYSDNKAGTISFIALKMAEAGADKYEVGKIFKEALETANVIIDLQYKADALLEIASNMAKAKLFAEALKTVSPIKYSDNKARTVNYIASRMAEAGLDTGEISNMFKQYGIKPPK